MKKIAFLPLVVFIIAVGIFFRPVLLDSKLPIPADTIIGLYHPFRDLYASQYPNGIPYKNALITDPVRQQYPWKELAIEIEKSGSLPLWNPYSFSGTPLLGTMQSGALYPLNSILFVLPFAIGWSAFIIMQPLLGGLFFYLYTKNLKLRSLACVLGAITFVFSGFSIAWLEWGNIMHTALWLPLILLSIDKVFNSLSLRAIVKQSKESSTSNHKIATSSSTPRNDIFWSIVFILALTCSFFAGHLQIFFYVLLTSFVYFLARWWQWGRPKKVLLLITGLFAAFVLVTIVQWLPTVQFILQSARDIDQLDWQKMEGWFIPYQHLIQFIAPDFFGNPTTLNYWGTWNYGELVGYVGITPLLLAFLAIFGRRDKKTYFFSAVLFTSLLFALPTIFAQIPYQLHIPLFSTSQPTRLLFLVDFSLAILASLGVDFLLKQKQKKVIIIPLLFLLALFGCVWVFIFSGFRFFPTVTPEQVATAKRNLILPTGFLGASIILLLLFCLPKLPNAARTVIIALFICLTIVDLVRFGEKFTPFTDQAYLFPQTKAITFLQKDTDQFRIMTTDSRLLPPNFSTVYRLQSVDGYDPLYMRRYAEIIAASERGKSNITPPFGFNRIITPHNADSRIIDLLGVRYILSMTDLPKEKYTKVLEEGQTKVYKNPRAFPRAFFVASIKTAHDKQAAINLLFDQSIDLHKVAIVEDSNGSFKETFSSGKVHIGDYQANSVHLKTDNKSSGFLVLMDSYYPTWHAQVCSIENDSCRDARIYRTNYQFRGILVPAGKHHIIFRNSLL